MIFTHALAGRRQTANGSRTAVAAQPTPNACVSKCVMCVRSVLLLVVEVVLAVLVERRRMCVFGCPELCNFGSHACANVQIAGTQRLTYANTLYMVGIVHRNNDVASIRRSRTRHTTHTLCPAPAASIARAPIMGVDKIAHISRCCSDTLFRGF